MAYSTLLSLEKAIDQILDQDRFSVSPQEKKLITSLDKCVVSFQAFLEDSPGKAKNLEARIRDAAAKAEDIVERFLLKQIRYNYGYTKRISILRRIKFKYQLQKVKDEMDKIAAELVEIQNRIMIEDQKLGDSIGAGSSSQVADTGKINMVGFTTDLIDIKEKLCGRAQKLLVVPILGMGGIGKTTLARSVYDDQLIMEHFQVRVWVTVSQDYSARRIILDLLGSMNEFDPNLRKESMAEVEHNNELAVKVHKILIGRRFLIVMDDVWSTKVLDDVNKLFPNDGNGSRIMLTTRLTEVARYVNDILPHEMRLMDADQSWNLLRRKVFINQDHVPREVESIGREIARSCGGLPLAIVVIAGLLSAASKNLNSWKEVAGNIRSSLATSDDGQIEKILSLSYTHLPHHLRPCFLYTGGFPEDHEIKATQLIRLWIAESFVKPVVSKELEDTAEKYLEDLVGRSLTLVTKRNSSGKIKCCTLHDMVREMCITLSEEEKFFVHLKGRGALERLKNIKDLKRISIYNSDLNSFTNFYSSTIRTIICFQYRVGSFSNVRMLSVLNLLRVRFLVSDLLPDQFFELFHLRYLALCYSNPIPKAISNLQSLQTLIIGDITDTCLPNEIWNMPQLRHLILSKVRFPDADYATSTLENLQTLGKVQNLMCSISNLNMIPNLRKLRLNYSWASGEMLLHNLVHLQKLEKLHLKFVHGRPSSIRYNYGKPNLLVPNSLKKLTMVGWGFRGPYLDIVGPFPNLGVLKLKSFNFKGQVWRTSDEDFPRLEFLLLEKSNVRLWDIESSHFPRLKSLHIRSCLDLEEIPGCIGEIPTVELIELKLCTDSLVESAKLIQLEAQSYGYDSFQVRCIDFKPTGSLSPPPPSTPSPQQSPLLSPSPPQSSVRCLRGWTVARKFRQRV